MILNLGCGARTSSHPDVVNIDWSLYLRLSRNKVLRKGSRLFLGADRRARLDGIAANVLVHDLRKGIPFSDNSADAVYHSHMLEHLDRDVAPEFQREVLRVLKPGGIQRIVVPDFEVAVRRYIEEIDRCEVDPSSSEILDERISMIIEQSVRRGAAAAASRGRARRLFENRLLGDARRRGETHQWMYDRFTLPLLLTRAGFSDVEVVDHLTSRIPDWDSIGLDRLENGSPYKNDSLYVEAIKPSYLHSSRAE